MPMVACPEPNIKDLFENAVDNASLLKDKNFAGVVGDPRVYTLAQKCKSDIMYHQCETRHQHHRPSEQHISELKDAYNNYMHRVVLPPFMTLQRFVSYVEESIAHMHWREPEKFIHFITPRPLCVNGFVHVMFKLRKKEQWAWK